MVGAELEVYEVPNESPEHKNHMSYVWMKVVPKIMSKSMLTASVTPLPHRGRCHHI